MDIKLKELVEALRNYFDDVPLVLEAADAIESLSAENERLRKAVLRYEDELGILDTLPLVDQREAEEGET